MKIGILNSGGYNFNSIRFALNRFNITDVSIVRSKMEFDQCDKIIIPGVGHAKTAMDLLHKQNLTECIQRTAKPVLGICLGMQIMCNFSEEGNVQCLGIFDNNILRLPQDVKTPQMGWNRLISVTNEYMENITNEDFIEKSRTLRKNQTTYEKQMWTKLRNNQLGVKFRRQHPIDNKYIADFVCLEKRLIIEIDGGQHCQSRYDKIRDNYLIQNNFRVVRFWNSDIYENLEGCVEIVKNVVGYSPSPLPSPKEQKNLSCPHLYPLPKGEEDFSTLADRNFLSLRERIEVRDKNLFKNQFVYFANSYYAPICKYTESFVDYENIKISATIRKDNFFGCQFHPEKSGKIGEEILREFVYEN